jgi:uncharacterized protein YndB with AHSA1/START domain
MPAHDLARFIDRWTVEYVRTYPHPIDRVWRAITDPKEFGQWFIRGDVELREGGAFQFQSGGWTGKVLAIEPPRRIRFGDALSYFEYELSGVAGGTRMRFVQHFDPAIVHTPVPDDLGGDIPVPGTPWKPGFVGGWHAHFDSLGDLLDGVPMGSHLPPTEFQALAKAWARDGLNAGLLDERGAARLVLQFRRKERWNELNKIYREHIKAAVPPE